MKKIISIYAFITFSCYLSAQINLEQVYDSASSMGGGINGNKSNQLMIINFENSGERYVKINRLGKSIEIYNLNHSLQKSISLSFLPLDGAGRIGDILYLSENLFDLDNGIEFMYAPTLSGSIEYTAIADENGSILFSDTAGPIVKVNTPMQQYPIYNTSQGTKMILSYEPLTNSYAKVFSLPGTLSTAIAEANGQLMQAQEGQGQFSGLYPNPSSNSVTLQYQLPQSEPYGEIVLYNTQGAEVKRYKVDNTFNDILLDNTMLPAGTYFYQLQTAKGAVGVKKSVVVK